MSTNNDGIIPEGWAFAPKVNTHRLVLMRKADGVEVSLHYQTLDDNRSHLKFVWLVEHDTLFENGLRPLARLPGSLTPAEALRRVDAHLPVLAWKKA